MKLRTMSALIVVLLVAIVVTFRYTRAQANIIGFSISGTDCIADVSPIAENATESVVNSVECTIRMEEIAFDTNAKENKHCVAEISPIVADETTSKVRSISCFATFQDAIDHASSGTVHISESITAEELAQNLRDTQTINATTVIGIWWENPQYSTSSGARTWTWTTTDSRVCNGVAYASATMPSGWNDIVSSAHAYSNCSDFENYEHSSYAGLRIDCTQACPAMGDMNDKTSSWRIDNIIP